MSAEGCPRWDRCSANICPLDPHWRDRVHLDGERVCAYLTELAKPGGLALLRGVLQWEQVEAISAAAPGVMQRWGRIRRTCEVASRSGSKIASANRMRAAT